MKPLVGLHACDCCDDICNQEFKKIVEFKNAGVAIYRYVPQTQDERLIVIETKEIFVLRNISDEDLILEEFTAELGKTNITCPRCVKLIERAEKLVRDIPKVNIQEVTSVCDHCYMRQSLQRPCCEEIVEKFLRFCTNEAEQREEQRQRVKAWLSKTHTLKKRFVNIQGNLIQPRGRSEYPDRKIPNELVVKNESERLKKGKQGEEETILTPLKITSFLDYSEELEPLKTKSKLMRSSIIKSREGDGVPEVIIAFSGEIKRHELPSKSYSFDTIVKSPSEVDVSVFKFIFPQDKIATSKLVRAHVSSSELIRNTHQMLQEKAEAEKNKREEENKKRREEEERKNFERDKRLEKIIKVEKQHEVVAKNVLKQANAEFQGKIQSIKVKQSKEAGKSTDENKKVVVTGKKLKSTEAKPDKSEGREMKAKLQVIDKQPDQTDKLAKQGKAEKDREFDEKKTKPTIEDSDVKPETDKSLKKATQSEQKAEVGKKHDISAIVTLKQQLAKQAKAEKDRELNTKKTKQAAKNVEEKQKQTEKKIDKRQQPVLQKPTIGDSDIESQKEKLHKKAKQSEPKTDVEKKHDIAAATNPKKQLAEHSKAEKDQKLDENKARQAGKKLEERPQPAEKKLEKKQQIEGKVIEERPASPKSTIPKSQQKAEDPDRTAAQKAKEQKQRDIAAANILKQQLAEIIKAELEAEMLRKQLEKEREIAEKKSKLAEKGILSVRGPSIKPFILQSEHDVYSPSEGMSRVITGSDEEITDIIIGGKIYQREISHKKFEHEQAKWTLKQSEKVKPDAMQKPEQFAEKNVKQVDQLILTKPKPEQIKLGQRPERPKSGKKLEKPIPAASTNLPPESDVAKGVIRYALSDSTFIDKGWTMLPTEKVVRKMNVYRMRPAKPEFDWFEHHKYKRTMTYDTGEVLAEFDDSGRGRWYYRNGKLALDYYDAEEINAGQRFVVYSSGEPDERGRSRPRTVLATFDYLGNGIVFDHSGKIRLKYNQTEGVLLDRAIGPPSRWKWHTLNDPPILQQVMIDTQMPYKDPIILKMGDINADMKRPDNEEMLAIEFENFIKEKSQKLSQSFKPFQIRMKAMKINEYFSLRVMDQASVYLLFRDGTSNLKINIGMVLDHKEIVDTDTAEISEVSNSLDKLPACTDSIAALQRVVAQAQAHERSRLRHDSRVNKPRPSDSVDELHAGCSRPLRPPLPSPPHSSVTCVTSNSKTTPSRFKPSSCNLYYSTQLY